MAKKWLFLVPLCMVLLTLFANIGVSLDLTDATAIYENYSGGSIWDRSNQVFINNMSKSGTVPVVSEGITTNSSIGNFTNGYYYQDNLALWSSSENFSISLWAEMKATSDYGNNNAYFISYDEVDTLDLWISYTAPYIFRFQTSKCDTISTSSALYVSVNSWNLITAIYDGTNGVCKIYINESVHGSVATGAGGTNKNTKISFGLYSDRSGGQANDWILNQITFWNKTLTTSDIDWLYNNGTGQNYTSPIPKDEFLILNYLNPDFLNISENCDNITMTINPQTSEYPILNCSLWLNDTLNYTENQPLNDSAVSTSLNLANGSYGFYWDCYAGDLYNTTINYTLNVMCAYPYTAPSTTSCPACLNCVPTRQYCADNTTLYQEIYREVKVNGLLTTCNETRLIDCPYGCNSKTNACALSTYEAWINNGALFVGVLVAFIVVVMAGRKAKGIRF